MTIKAIIFDVGGVLHSNEIDYMYEDIKKTLKITNKQFEENYPKLVALLATGKINEQEFWNKFLQATGSTEQLPKESLFLGDFKKQFKVHQNVLSLVKKLKEKGYELAILSDTILSHYSFILEQGLYDDFSVKVFSFQVGFKKSQREIYELTIEKLGVKPEEAIFIDDKKENIEAARRVGMMGIHFQNFDQLVNELSKVDVDCI